jgi:acetyl esterase
MSHTTPPSLDPSVLSQLLGSLPLPKSVPEMRALLENFAVMLNAGAPTAGELHERVTIREVEGRGVHADVLVPEGPGPHPVLVYLHGGGWVSGSPRTHRKLAHRFAEAGFLVVNVDYRLAPEHPFPAGFEDCIAAVRWAASEAGRFGGDPERLAIGGDSAGGNLSAATAIALARERSAPRIRAALLLYGVFDFATIRDGLAADERLAELGRDMVDLMVHSYLGANAAPALLHDPRVSPVRAADRLPPSFVVVGGADPLVGQARRLAEELERAGVPHEHVLVDGMPHGFAQMEFFPQARQTIDRMVEFLRKHLRVE